MQAIGLIYDVWNFLSSNWIQIGVAVGYCAAAARIIVALTPTPADDTALASVVAWLKKIGLHIE